MRDPFRCLFAALIVALGGSLFWGVRQHRELLRERRGAADDRQAFVDLEGRLTAAERARLSAEARLEGQVGLDIRRMFPESRSVPESATIDKFNVAVDRDPVWGPFYRKLERRRILSRYNILLAALKIPPEKLAPLQDLLVERAIASRSIVHQLRDSGRKFNSPQVLAAVDRATDEVDARIEKLVGGKKARELKEWNSAIYSYGNAPNGPVAQDAITLSEAGFELSTDQLVQLALIRYEVTVLSPQARSGSGSDRLRSENRLNPAGKTTLRPPGRSSVSGGNRGLAQLGDRRTPGEGGGGCDPGQVSYRNQSDPAMTGSKTDHRTNLRPRNQRRQWRVVPTSHFSADPPRRR